MQLNKIFTLHLDAFTWTPLYTPTSAASTWNWYDVLHNICENGGDCGNPAPPTTSSGCMCVFAFAICVFEVAFAYQLCSASMIHGVFTSPCTAYKVFHVELKDIWVIPIETHWNVNCIENTLLWCRWTIEMFWNAVRDKITAHCVPLPPSFIVLLYVQTVEWINKRLLCVHVWEQCVHIESIDICAAALNHFRRPHLHQTFHRSILPFAFYRFSLCSIFTHQTANIRCLLLTFQPVLMRAIGVKP